MGILLGIAAAVFWGLGDFFVARLTRRIGTTLALVAIQLLSLVAWVGVWLARPHNVAVDAGLWLVMGATAACHVLGLLFVYRAFEIGTLSLVSPISAAFAVVTGCLALASGEHPPGFVLAGAGLLVAGVALATRSPSAPDASFTLRGIPEAVLSAVAFGTMFWLFYFHVQPRLGYGLPLVVLKAAAASASIVAALSMRRRDTGATRISSPPVFVLATAAAATDTLAWLAYIWGSHTASATVVTALASLFSVVTVLLAWMFLRERLAPHQWAGVGVILLGILLVSV